MIFLNLRQYILLILILHFPLASFGQELSNTQTKSEQQKQIAKSRFDSVQLLDHARRLSDDARELKPLEEIPLQARLADTVWALDQSLAERLLARSFELTVGLLKEPSDPVSGSATADLQTTFALITLIAAKHDAKLEKKLKDRWQEATVSLAEKADSKMNPDPTQQACC